MESCRHQPDTHPAGIVLFMYIHDRTPSTVFTTISSQIMIMYPVTRPVLRHMLSVCVPAFAAVRSVKPSWKPHAMDVILMSQRDDFVATKLSGMNIVPIVTNAS